MNKSIDALMKELLNAGYNATDIAKATAKADAALALEKAEQEKKQREAAAAQEKIKVARDRAATAFADYLLALGVEEALGVSKDEAVAMAHETFEDLEDGVQHTLSLMASKRRVMQADVDSDLDEQIEKFLRSIGVI